MKFAFRGVSGAALLLGLTGGFQSAWAQQTPAPTPTSQPPNTVATVPDCDPVTPGVQTNCPPVVVDDTTDRVVVQGSIVGDRESEELAIDVYTADDLKNDGSPNIIEFVQNLSTVGESVGNMDISLAANGDIFTDLYGPGFANVNLRGLSDVDSERTINLLNGRRTTGNANLLPTQVLQQVEVLKDGASATYGAGAVGGVVNFVTRKDFNGITVEGEQKFIEDVDNGGNQSLKMTWGASGDSSNLLISASYEHTGEVTGADFDWANNPYTVNPRQYSTNTGSNNPGVLYSNSALAGAVPDFTTASCEAVGGINPRITTAHPQESDTNPAVGTGAEDNRRGIPCYFNFAPFNNVVQEQNIFRVFAQYEAQMTENMDFHADLSYSKTDAPHLRNSPSQTPDTARAPYEQGGTGFPTTQCGAAAGRCVYTVPTNHPAFADFVARANVGRGVADPDGAGGLSGSSAVVTIPGTPSFYHLAFWRPFGTGGIPGVGPSQVGFRRSDFWAGTLEVSGNFSEDGFFGLGRFLPEGTTYKYSIYGTHSKGTTSTPDVVSHRLQEALNGFGGPNCQAPDLTPTTAVPTGFVPSAANPGPNGLFVPRLNGETTAAYNARIAPFITQFNATIGTQNAAQAGKNGCQYFNPFASAWAANAATGQANPSFNAALANDPALVDWLFTDATTQSNNRSVTFNAEWNGILPGFELPGGEINWTAGTEWRQTEYENYATDPLYDADRYRCPWDPWTAGSVQVQQQPGGIGCDRGAGGRGPGPLMSKAGRPYRSQDRQIISGFTKWNFPILDNWSATGTVRYEEISGSIGDFVYSASTKYDITDWLSARGSWSLNFASPNPDILDNDGIIEPALTDSSAGPTVPTLTRAQNGLTVETAEQFQIGFIYDYDDLLGADSNLRMELTYWNYFIEGEIATASGNALTGRVFTGPDDDNAQDTVLDCNHPVLAFITLTSPCVQAVVVGGVLQNPTTATSAADIEQATTLILNGPGIKQSGVDFKIDYRVPALGGYFGIGGEVTRNLEYRSKQALFEGVTVGTSEDWLGNLNRAAVFGTGKQGSRWRGSVYTSFSVDDHTFRLTGRYISGVRDESGCQNINGNGSTTGGGTTCFGVNGDDRAVADFNWRWQVPSIDDFELRLTVLNITDEDPPEAAIPSSLPYNSYIANPYGRQWEIGFSKTF